MFLSLARCVRSNICIFGAGFVTKLCIGKICVVLICKLSLSSLVYTVIPYPISIDVTLITRAGRLARSQNTITERSKLIVIKVVSESRLFAEGLDRRGSVAVPEERCRSVVGVVQVIVIGFQGRVNSARLLIRSNERRSGSVQTSRHTTQH